MSTKPGQVQFAALAAGAFAEGFMGIPWGTGREEVFERLTEKGYANISKTYRFNGYPMEMFAGMFAEDLVGIEVVLFEGGLGRGEYGESGSFDKVWHTKDSDIYLPFEHTYVSLAYMSKTVNRHLYERQRSIIGDDF